jgi:hypothetical protein
MRLLGSGCVVVALLAGCGGGGNASAKNITCKEVKASTEKTEAVARQIIADVRSKTHGKTVSSEIASNAVNNVCEGSEGSKPDDKAYYPALGGVEAYITAGEQQARAAKQAAIEAAENTTCGEIDFDNVRKTEALAERIIEVVRAASGKPPASPQELEARDVREEIVSLCAETSKTSSVESGKPYAKVLVKRGMAEGLTRQTAESLATR